MRDYETLRLDFPADHVARVTIDRPEVANALNSAFFVDLSAALDAIESEDDIRVWLLTGAARADGRQWFSAGVDMKGAAQGPEEWPVPPLSVLDRIDDMLKPSIAVIGGVCTTGALELALACDLRVAARSARLSDWHLKRTGLGIGAWGMAARLSRLVGVDKAKELLLLSREIDGAEAERIGLVNAAVPDDELMAHALEWATTIGSMPRRGVRTTLGYLQLQADMSKRDAMRWAELTPEFMGVQLRPFRDAADRFYADRPATDPP
jgi:enoyl-CoA hydratase/carnithine racemase